MTRMSWSVALLAAIALAGCRDSTEGQRNPPQPAPSLDASTASAVPGPDAARAVVADYAARFATGDRAGAAKLWADPHEAAQFAATLDDYPAVAMVADSPIDAGRARQSRAITVPLALELTLRSGAPYEMRCNARLDRRPGGGSEAGWRIRAIDC